MHDQFHIRISALSFLVALSILFTLWNPVVFAADQAVTLPVESSESGVIDDEAFVIDSGETQSQSTEATYEDGILLLWDVDSTLTYVLNEDNIAWKIFDSEGNELTGGNGEPASAGYMMVGTGTWYGNATVKLTIINSLNEDARLRLLFRDGLSQKALEIISTLQADDDTVQYESSTGLLVIPANTEGVVTMTIDAGILQEANMTLSEAGPINGWIEVVVESPTHAPVEEIEPTTEATETVTEETTEPTEPESEATTEPETEPSSETTEPEITAAAEPAEPETETTTEPTEAEAAPTSETMESTTEETEPENTGETTEPNAEPNTDTTREDLTSE